METNTRLHSSSINILIMQDNLFMAIILAVSHATHGVRLFWSNRSFDIDYISKSYLKPITLNSIS